jgi:lipopolysaccharide transport system ATP-binding protein
MSSEDIVIKVENISKLYRIGMKDEMRDSFALAIFDFIKRPFINYRKYRSLYKFDDIELDHIQNSKDAPSDIIWAVNDVSFEVSQGEVLGIIGRNGAGKSTLLKILCRITDPTRGYAEIRGKVSSLLEVGTGFHQELTGRENIYLNGTILGMTKKEVDHKFDEIVGFSGVEKFIDTPVKRYSSGMMVRLAFSVAAHLEPEILIIDEVLAVGDADFQKKCINKMEDVGEKGRTVLFVSHNLPAITRLCKRAILLDEGRIVEDGPAEQVVSAYLTSDLGTKAAREWPNPAKAPAGPVVRLRAVRVKTEEGHITETFDIRKPIIFEVEYEVLESGHVLLPHFALTNEFGECAFISIDLDPAWRNRPRSIGNYISKAIIPGNFLSEGLMFIGCYCLTLNPDSVQFSKDKVITFHVADSLDGDSARGDYAKKMPGVVRPILDWRTQYDSNLRNGTEPLVDK